MDISSHDPTGVMIASIEGNGAVFLGANNLAVGSNNLSTIFSGVMEDAGGIQGGTGGSLTKISVGTLTLSSPNVYTGDTTMNGGTLLVTTKRGSGTGNGHVQVDAGILGGPVTIGAGSGSGAFLAPGTTGPGALSLQKALIFNSDATYNFELNSRTAKADEVTARGVTIKSGVLFSFIGLGRGTLIPGTVFTVMNNTGAGPIAGAFGNLADGSIFTANGNTFQASYQLGDGNDLTLTVVP